MGIKTIDADSTLRILMVGNSFCYYYVEELYDLLMERPLEGVEGVEIYNLYYSGCTLTMHYDWWKNNEAHYDLYKVDTTGRHKVETYPKWTLEQALAVADWDYISLHGRAAGSNYLNVDKREEMRDAIAAVAQPLLDRFHELHPKAQLLWQRTWFFEVGRETASHTYTAEDGPVYNEGMQDICDYMCSEFCQDKPYKLMQVNSGAAWTEARRLDETEHVLPYGGLCARIGFHSFGDRRPDSGDGYHDGDIGGGQLLNAYVWYMTLTGNTDLGSSQYAPVYKDGARLSAEHIELLKRAAMSIFKK